ncbi:4-hydroxy-3-methylbut-2-enyl diphosphate reductase [Criibacterium bergeronii]|uniref:4-hydroxy-3-methylbut-2-enyl diphosphate reductase n=1 Tax=Criibacterium bergeronii TaxID=1871336 RepID=A0A552VDQ6_9FIRM|nr:4-hydroxy-3-methylbut-2-enyl diphosphate reductase [Criibacterium bergeronii]TRW28607.1 4-hydroxy-3-methylbut-2-enyl diphosphate reductase [Criibacterium bergeronii]
MEIIVSEHSGYCYGVKKAIDTAMEKMDEKGILYSFGDIIHNKRAIQRLSDDGLIVVNDIKSEYESILFRSHGVEKNIYTLAKQKGVEVIDATCVFVKKIQDTVEQNYQSGKNIIIAGDKNHPEVIGINSRADYTAIFITSAEDVDKLDIDLDKEYILVFQTTFNTQKYETIVDKIKAKYKNITIFNTICSATKKRQDSAVELAKKVDLMIVIGDKKSSNSKKLFELTAKYVKSVFIEDKKELESYDFDGINKAGITAGASTPDFVIEEVIDYIKSISKNQ